MTHTILTDASLSDPNVSPLIVSVARALCFARGEKPDEVVWNQRGEAVPRWKLLLVEAQAAVRAVEAHLRNETFAVTDTDVGIAAERAAKAIDVHQAQIAISRDARLEHVETMLDAIHNQTVVWLPQMLETLRGSIQGEVNPAMQRLAADMERALLTIAMDASLAPVVLDERQDA